MTLTTRVLDLFLDLLVGVEPVAAVGVVEPQAEVVALQEVEVVEHPVQEVAAVGRALEDEGNSFLSVFQNSFLV